MATARRQIPVSSAGRVRRRSDAADAISGGATISPLAVSNAANTNDGVTSGSRPRTATMNRSSSSVSRTQSVALTASTITDTIRRTVEFEGGTTASRRPAATSGTVQRYPADGANHDPAAARAIHSGRVYVHTTAG